MVMNLKTIIALQYENDKWNSLQLGKEMRWEIMECVSKDMLARNINQLLPCLGSTAFNAYYCMRVLLRSN